MSTTIPRHRAPVIAAWLATRGHTLMTAPESLIALAVDAPDVFDGEPGIGEPHPSLPLGDDHWTRWF